MSAIKKILVVMFSFAFTQSVSGIDKEFQNHNQIIFNNLPSENVDGATDYGTIAEEVVDSPPTSPDSAYVSISITSGSNPSCNGSFITFTATPLNGGSSPVYQWKLNGIPVGSNSPDFTSNALSSGHVISCEMISNMAGVVNNPAISNAIAMIVQTPGAPGILISTDATSICPGTMATFNAAITNGGISPTFQWKKNGINTGTNSAVYSSSSINNADVITCVLTSNSNCVTTTTATSNSIVMSVSNAAFVTPSITISASSTSLCNTPSLTFTATTINEGFNPAFQWKVNGIVAGTNSHTFTSTSLNPNDVVSCSMTANSSCPVVATVGSGTSYNSTFSSIAFFPTLYGNGRQQYLIKATELAALGIPAGYIQSIGVNLSAPAGSPATLNGYTLKMAATTSASVTNTFQTSGFTTVFGPVNYTPIVGGLNTIPFSTPFYWNGSSNLIVDLCFSNQITGSLCYASTISFTSFNSCTFYVANGIAGAGACLATVGSVGIARPNMTIASTPLGTFSSNSITMIGGGSLVPTVSISSSSTSICPGNSVTFNATTTHGGIPAYQWKVNGNNVGTNSSTFTSNTLTNGAVVSCVITSSLVCATPNIATSNNIIISVNATLFPSLTIQAVANNICEGQSISFNATPVNGGPAPSYQWKVNNINAGTNSSSFTNVNPVDGDIVKCIMTSSYQCPVVATVTSNSVTTNVHAYVTPSVSIVASVNNVCPGTLVNITSNVIHGGSFSGQWKINGNNVIGSFPNYLSNSFVDGDLITYEITSSLPCCLPGNVAVSNSVTMNILNHLPPVVSISPSANPVCIGSGVTLAATALNPGINAIYQWKLNGNNVGTNSLLYTSPPLSNNDVIQCEYTSTVACPNTKTMGQLLYVSNTNYGSFFPTAYGNGKQQFLLKASELLLIGLTAGNIHSIGVEVSGSTVGNPSILNDYTIRIGNTNVSTMSTTFQTPSLTTVYGPLNYTPTLGSLNMMNFATPYYWDGVSNLVVEICFSNQVNGSVAYRNTYSIYTYNPTTLYQVNGVSPGVCNQTTGMLSSTRPNFTITSIPVNTVSSNSITMGVTPLALPGIEIAVGSGGNPTCDGAQVSFIATSTFSGPSPVYQWKVNGLNVGSNLPTYSSSSLNDGDVVSCQMTSNHNCVSNSIANSNVITMVMTACNCSLAVKAFVEGYYMGGGNLSPVLFNQGLEINSGSANSDSITVLLYHANNLLNAAYTYHGILQSNGNIQSTFPGSAIGNSYYIALRHRNSIETWSANPIMISEITNYDFTSGANKAYGSNQSEVESGVWALYSGDVNQDENIDLVDAAILESDINAFQYGNFSTDINGDGNVDLLDSPIVEMNINQFVFSSHP